MQVLSGGAFSVLRIRMARGASHPLLYHARTSEFFLVTRGGARASIGGRRRRLRRGDFVSIPPGVAHGFRAGEGGIEVLAVFAPALDLERPDIVVVP